MPVGPETRAVVLSPLARELVVGVDDGGVDAEGGGQQATLIRTVGGTSLAGPTPHSVTAGVVGMNPCGLCCASLT